MYNYRITVELLGATAQLEPSEDRFTRFQVQNHDDLLKIVEAIRCKGILDGEKSAALAIGLKLLSEIVLEKRRDPLFEPLLKPVQSFIRQLKTVQTKELVGQNGSW